MHWCEYGVSWAGLLAELNRERHELARGPVGWLSPVKQRKGRHHMFWLSPVCAKFYPFEDGVVGQEESLLAAASPSIVLSGPATA